MKRLLLFSISTAICFSAFSQSNQEDIDMIQAMYGKEKKEIMADFIIPTDSAKKIAFWNLYDAYETERKALGKQRIALLEKYANDYNKTDDKSTDDIMKQTLALQKSTDGLIASYYEKIRKSVGAIQAGQFYQLESYLLSAIRVHILSNIPFIGELGRK